MLGHQNEITLRGQIKPNSHFFRKMVEKRSSGLRHKHTFFSFSYKAYTPRNIDTEQTR